jgi:hypothetical protein
VRDLIDGFLRTRPFLQDGDQAASQCRVATTDLVEFLSSRGVAAEMVWVRGHRVEPTEASRRALLADRHMLTRLPGGGFVDITRRQYEPKGQHPRYYSSEGDLSFDWAEIDDGPAEGRLEKERWRSLCLAKWEPGIPSKGLLTRDALYLWATDAEDAPHHAGALHTLAIPAEDVDCYLFVDSDGTVALSMFEDTAAIEKRLAALDSRLRVDSALRL